MQKRRLRYREHKANARFRGIDFLMTFEEWWGIWHRSGKWEQRGRAVGQYVMGRRKDRGPYKVGNVDIILVSNNGCQGKLSKQQRRRIIAKRKAGGKVVALARKYKVTPRTIIRLTA